MELNSLMMVSAQKHVDGRGLVRNVPRRWLCRVLAGTGCGRETKLTPSWMASSSSIKLKSAPESRKVARMWKAPTNQSWI